MLTLSLKIPHVFFVICNYSIKPMSFRFYRVSKKKKKYRMLNQDELLDCADKNPDYLFISGSAK